MWSVNSFLTLSIIFFVALKGIAVFSKGVSLKEFLFSTNWSPDTDVPKFGALNFIAGSTFVSIGAVILSAPVSIALAIFINYISPKLGDKFKTCFRIICRYSFGGIWMVRYQYIITNYKKDLRGNRF